VRGIFGHFRACGPWKAKHSIVLTKAGEHRQCFALRPIIISRGFLAEFRRGAERRPHSPLPEDQRVRAAQADPAHGDCVLAEVDEQLPLPRPVDNVIVLSSTVASSLSLQ
jgi:hypothetical protein